MSVPLIEGRLPVVVGVEGGLEDVGVFTPIRQQVLSFRCCKEILLDLYNFLSPRVRLSFAHSPNTLPLPTCWASATFLMALETGSAA